MMSDQARSDHDLARVFVERRAGLRAIARRAGEQDAEDVVQEAFLKVVETSKRQEVRKLDHLLSRVVRCAAIDRVRRRISRRALSCDGVVEEIPDAGADPERVLMGAQRLRRVLAIIDAMPPRRRQVFLLHRIDELTYLEIARQAGVSVKAVEKHIHLALRQLADNDA